MTGYVHKPYPRIYAMLARCAGFDSALIVRGVEGGVIPSLRQVGKAFYYHDKGEEQSLDFRPSDLAIDQPVVAAPIPEDAQREAVEDDPTAPRPENSIVAQLAAQAGLEALGGSSGPTRESLVCGGALCLWHLKRHDSLQSAAAAVRRVLDSGAALKRLKCASGKKQ